MVQSSLKDILDAIAGASLEVCPDIIPWNILKYKTRPLLGLTEGEPHLTANV